MNSMLGALVGEAAGATLEFCGCKITEEMALNAMKMPGGGRIRVGPGQITDDGRIVASLSTIKKLLNANCSIVIIAHLGRPKGERKNELSLAPVAKRLGELLKMNIEFSSHITGADAKVSELKSGQILLLENIRYEAAETSKDEAQRIELSTKLARYGKVYIGDGFGAVHRKHASVYELAKMLPHAAGDLVTAEVEVLEKLTKNPSRPYGVVLGGAKVSDKIGVISNFLEKVNTSYSKFFSAVGDSIAATVPFSFLFALAILSFIILNFSFL
jgi:phosphoglycerate kinase